MTRTEAPELSPDEFAVVERFNTAPAAELVRDMAADAGHFAYEYNGDYVCLECSHFETGLVVEWPCAVAGPVECDRDNPCPHFPPCGDDPDARNDLAADR